MYREGEYLDRKTNYGTQIFTNYQNNPSKSSYESKEAIGWNYGDKAVPEELDYSYDTTGPSPTTLASSAEETGTYFSEQDLLGDYKPEENLTSLDNKDNSAIFAMLDYYKEKDSKAEQEKEEKEETEKRQSELSAAENQIREETKKKKFLIDFALKSLDYQAPEYRRVGKQQYIQNEQNS